jgi:hypothetical protein
MPAKNKFFSKFFCLLLFEATFTSVFKDKKSKISSKIIETKVFLTFLLVDGRIQIRIRTYDDGSGFERPRKHTDPDPQPWFLHRKLQAMVDLLRNRTKTLCKIICFHSLIFSNAYNPISLILKYTTEYDPLEDV